MMKSNINDEYLGADTALSPEVIDFLSSTENSVSNPASRQNSTIQLDEYEQAMVA